MARINQAAHMQPGDLKGLPEPREYVKQWTYPGGLLETPEAQRCSNSSTSSLSQGMLQQHAGLRAFAGMPEGSYPYIHQCECA